jgi:protein-L-isoaspartate(D-aspartate) O-methyltransferase
MMAIMAEQLGLAPGQRVLEIGTGTGYNAAVLAHVVGPGGSVVTVDIESDLVARARAGLAAAGYPEVRVSGADGGYGDPAGAPFDRIVVTAGAWDIAPAWLEQLAPGGRLVLPLAVRGIQLSVGLDRRDGHWVSSSAFRCGFVRVLGAFADPESFRPVGETGVFAQAADGRPADSAALAAALAGPAADLSTGVVMSSRDELGDLDFWLALAEPKLTRLAFIQASSGFRGSLLPLGGLAGRDGAGQDAAGPGSAGPYGVCGLVESGPDGGPPGAVALRGYGPGGPGLAAYLAGRVREWELAGRPGIADLVLTVALRDPSAPPAAPAAGQVVFTRPHVQIAAGFRAS